MNHRKFGTKLGRNRREREALFKSLTRSLFTHGLIETTQAKAKSVISIVEKLSHTITTKDIVFAQRELSKYIQDKNLVGQIYAEFKKVFADQVSNFTKTWKTRIRQGDNSVMVKLSFVKPYSLKTVKTEVIKETKEVKEVKKAPVAKKAVTKKLKK